MNRSTTRGQTQRFQKQPVMPRQPPQPSIRSAQTFNQPPPVHHQSKYNQNQNQNQNQYYETDDSDPSQLKKSAMTIQQAITLITLRLGSIETKLMNPNFVKSTEYDGSNFDDTEKEQIFERLNSLETKVFNSSSLILQPQQDYKQQIEMLTQTVMQFKNSIMAITKENKELKTSLSSLKQEMTYMKDNLEQINKTSQENQNKLFEMMLKSASLGCDGGEIFRVNGDDENEENQEQEQNSIDVLPTTEISLSNGSTEINFE